MNNEEKRQFYMDHIYSHRKDMYRILWSMFGDPDIVEEIAQGVLEHAWKGLDTLKDQNKSWAWVKGILRNESRTHIRKKEESPAMEIWEPACEYIGEDDLLCYEQDVLDSIVKKETGTQITELLEQMEEKYALDPAVFTEGNCGYEGDGLQYGTLAVFSWDPEAAEFLLES